MNNNKNKLNNKKETGFLSNLKHILSNVMQSLSSTAIYIIIIFIDDVGYCNHVLRHVG